MDKQLHSRRKGYIPFYVDVIAYPWPNPDACLANLYWQKGQQEFISAQSFVVVVVIRSTTRPILTYHLWSLASYAPQGNIAGKAQDIYPWYTFQIKQF